MFCGIKGLKDMAHMVTSVIKHLKIYWKLIRFSASLETEYRFSFFMEILVEFAYFGVTLLGIRVIFWNVNEIAGWNYYQLLTLYGVNMVFSEIILGLAFIFNLRSLPQKITYGGLDLILTKPISSQFAVSLWRPYFALIPGVIAGLVTAALGIGLGNLEINWLNLIPFGFLFACGLLIAYSLGMMIVTLAFWFINALSLPMLAQQFIFLSKHPGSIYERGWRLLFMSVIPVIFMVSVPTEALLGQWQLWWPPAALMLAIGFLFASHKLWQQALKSYCSASS